MSRSAASLSIRDLTITAPSGRVLLDVPALDIEAGTRLGLRGASGAGKSTFLFALAGLADRAKGVVRWDNADVLTLPEQARAAFRRSRIGIVFQDFHLFEELTAQENASVAALFAPRAERAAIKNTAGAALARFSMKHPGQDTATLSGGERQRVAVARALASDPPILLADEPTANLARSAADALARDLADQSPERTLVVASHDEAVLAAMDRVITLQDGQVVADV